jgi:putative flippase GtrA
MWITVEQLHWHSVLMKVIANIIVIILNFVFSKLFIFKKDGSIELKEDA